MGRKFGQSASPTARPRKAQLVAHAGHAGTKDAAKAQALPKVSGKAGSTGRGR